MEKYWSSFCPRQAVCPCLSLAHSLGVNPYIPDGASRPEETTDSFYSVVQSICQYVEPETRDSRV